MSDHAWILENLAAYLSGGLEASERERLEQHTADCALCAAALNDARALDVALTGLFVETRPSAALEDRLIQTLRNRPPAAWRLPMPAWLAVAAAALVLIGFTGAVANQFIVHGKFAFPKSWEVFSSSMVADAGGDVKNLDQLAQSSREGMLGEVAKLWLNEDNNQLGFYPPAQALGVKASSTIHTRMSGNLTITDAAKPPAPPPNDEMGAAEKKEINGPVSMADGSVLGLPPRGREAETYYRKPEATAKVGQSFITAPKALSSFQPGKMLDKPKLENTVKFPGQLLDSRNKERKEAEFYLRAMNDVDAADKKSLSGKSDGKDLPSAKAAGAIRRAKSSFAPARSSTKCRPSMPPWRPLPGWSNPSRAASSPRSTATN